ncbi:MAG: 30S ribosomal protein S8 [Deltaproteobacteria bacterium]|nr:30S ribosomal protein S8 [Deltaproteobacteria bacterium]
MSMTDPVSDMLTRIRNAAKARFKDVLMPNSSLKRDIAKILKEEGYVKDISIVKDKGRSFIKIMLKYTPSKKNAITSIKRISKPGLRRYVGKDEVPKVLSGLGIAILSTSRGVVTDRTARELGVGGELICTVY